MGSYGTNGNLELSKLVENLGYVGTVTKATFPVEVTVDGKLFTISATGAVEKAGPRPTVTSVTVTLENGNAVPEEKVEEGTALKINLAANIEGGTITSISPSVPYTTNGTEKSKTFTITGSANGESYSIEYTVQLSECYATPNPEAGKVAITKNRTLSGSTDITKMTYKNPVIPQGFSAIDTTAAKWQYEDETTLDKVKGWNDGLVIKDDLDNEFVWVPCTIETVSENSPIVEYSKKFDYPKSGNLSSASSSDISDSNDYKTFGDNVVIKAIPFVEAEQIETYEGFYVARYEAGLDSAVNDPDKTNNKNSNNNCNSIPVSKYGSKVWNYIGYENSYISAGKMINDSSKYGSNKSGLITGTQWDTIMKWFEKSNIGVGGNVGTQNWGTYKTILYRYEGTQNSTYFTYGNSKSTTSDWLDGSFLHNVSDNNTSISTTNLAYFHASGLNTSKGYQKNIADLGGNMWEWTSEKYLNQDAIARGGCASNGSESVQASGRICSAPTYTSHAYGFRVVIYIQEDE